MLLQDFYKHLECCIQICNCRFGYSIPNAYKSLGGALKELIDKTRKKKKRSFFEDRLDALRKSAEKARSELSQQEGSEKSISSENVYGQ